MNVAPAKLIACLDLI